MAPKITSVQFLKGLMEANYGEIINYIGDFDYFDSIFDETKCNKNFDYKFWGKLKCSDNYLELKLKEELKKIPIFINEDKKYQPCFDSFLNGKRKTNKS